jgi:phospholipid:diacylglycerol acyltransferase
MSFLRRRAPREETPDESPERGVTPDPERPAHLRVVSAEKLETLKKSKAPKQSKRKNFWIFGLGGLFGLIVAGFFANSNDLIDLSALDNMNLENLMDVLPAAFVRDAQQLQV